MKKALKILVFGFMVWLIGVIAAALIGAPTNNPTALQSLIQFLSNYLEIFLGIIFLILYFKGIHQNYLKEGFTVGIVWLIIFPALDWFITPSQGMLEFYFMNDITYNFFVIFIISLGIGYLLDKKLKASVNK